ncbi:hypothetical protein PtA15_4A77 [Puccinia triticina]|uniref:RlpA-like protein double-psi beta-barrel domain-containing protein n=1 Tax=Puccinia triticina TaxID=208348 RepID=A0ABY7CEZ0_9BASI|nr:uncharacterized protein PtA15_4A77 [Puccinia triticina]WAQ83629.1 hypothetical protein PtA15_4A77 [Puccinia triticina]
MMSPMICSLFVVLLVSVASSLATPLSTRKSHLERRFSGKATYFAPGTGACGDTNSQSDFIVAMNQAQYEGGSPCHKTVSIKNDATGKTVQAQVTDKCPGCAFGSLDLSPSAFQAIGNMDQGVLPARGADQQHALWNSGRLRWKRRRRSRGSSNPLGAFHEQPIPNSFGATPPNKVTSILIPSSRPRANVDEMLPQVEQIKTRSGLELTVCKAHHQQTCHHCCMDFTYVNQLATAEAHLSQAAKKHQDGDHLGPGRLRVGSEIRRPDVSGKKPPKPLDGRIVGVVEDIDEESSFCGETCYVIRLRDKSLMTCAIDGVHADEWLVKVDGHYVATSKALGVVSWE